MSDKGVIFSAPMVRALLDGRKTQTRRLIKPAPFIDDMGNFCAPDRKGQVWNWGQNIDGTPCLRNFVKKMPYAPGDRLYVREGWRTLQKWDAVKPRHLMDDVDKIDFAADGYPRNPLWAWGKNRPSIFLPRWASRLWLAVTDVRVQRLQDLSEADAIAEGIDDAAAQHFGNPIKAYAALWNHLHGAENDQSWEANPWIHATTFDVHRGNIDRSEA